MSENRSQHLEDIFHRALELAPQARSAFLDEACGMNQSIRREVESLLEHASEEGNTFAGLARDDAPQTIAHYRISAKLGQGGMGAVYRATDTKLGREVAIKVLPPSFAEDADRVARFTREAKVLASLNHPNIAQIYGIEERALVMELVPGATLQRPLPMETALNYAKQIAEALEAAHERGIVHRDLKPANIVVTPDGVVKLLDFGLAAIASVAGDPLSSPTITMQTAQSGVIMGTAAYMSPEQAAGKPVDKRADVWSFGVVLWESLTGRRLFEGETISLTLAGVLGGPIDFDKLPRETPAAVRGLLRRCLDRDVKNRLRDIGEARIAIESALVGGPLIESAPARADRPWLAWSVAAVAIACLAGVALLYFREKPPAPAASVRFQLPVPEGGNVGTLLNLSPDGRKLAFIANRRLWVHSFGSEDSRNLTDARGAPFWSPDSRFIGYVDGSLKRIEATGGPAQTVTDLPAGPSSWGGGTWNQDDLIVFAGAGALYHVPAAGGTPVKITATDFARHETGIYGAQFLPDGRHFIYVRRTRDQTKSAIYLGSVDASPEQQISKPLVSSYWAAAYTPSADPGIGYLLFMRGEMLMAQPFDNRRLELKGQAAPVAEQIGDGRGFSVSANGVLVYERTNLNHRQLTWYDRDGKVLGTAGDPGNYGTVAFSPDGTRAALSGGNSGQASSIWLLDLHPGTSARFVFGSTSNANPVWAPDGSRIVFSSSPDGAFDLYQEPANRAKDAEVLLKTDEDKYASGWSPDGRLLLYTLYNAKTKGDIWLLPLDGDRKPLPFLVTPVNERNARFSPDGRWVAYDSDESGNDEIYVRSFSMDAARTAVDVGGKWQVSNGCSNHPRWRADGRELLYNTCDGYIMAVEIAAASEFRPGPPQRLGIPQFTGNWDAASDGKRFLVFPLENKPEPYTVVLNWQADLPRK
jgi:eukaryotic-like serine/threonine-protein kinase